MGDAALPLELLEPPGEQQLQAGIDPGQGSPDYSRILRE
jgi:hypothetical protein